jgi:hypothetical protein
VTTLAGGYGKLQARLIMTSSRGLRRSNLLSCHQVGGLAFVRLIMTSVQRLEEKQPAVIRLEDQLQTKLIMTSVYFLNLMEFTKRLIRYLLNS